MALVYIRLQDDSGRPIDGTVTLEGTATYRLTTVAGRGSFPSVAAGTYTASVAPTRGSAVTRSVTISGSGAPTLAFTIPQERGLEPLPALQYLAPSIRSCRCNSGLTGLYDDDPWIAGVVGSLFGLAGAWFLSRKG